MTVWIAEDRSISVRPDQVVRTGWVAIDACRLGCRVRMAPEAVEKKFRRMVSLGERASWPPIVGHWDADRFVVDDGRHEYLAALMIGRERLFVCWLEAAGHFRVGSDAETTRCYMRRLRDGAVRQLARFIPWRSQVQILFPLPTQEAPRQ